MGGISEFDSWGLLGAALDALDKKLTLSLSRVGVSGSQVTMVSSAAWLTGLLSVIYAYTPLTSWVNRLKYQRSRASTH